MGGLVADFLGAGGFGEWGVFLFLFLFLFFFGVDLDGWLSMSGSSEPQSFSGEEGGWRGERGGEQGGKNQ